MSTTCFDTKTNWNDCHFDQFSCDSIHLSGHTIICGQLKICSTTGFSSTFGAGDGKIWTSDASGIGTWQNPIESQNVTRLVCQPSHGFVANTVLGWSGGTYNKPTANGLYDGEILGVVTKCYNVNCFDLTQAGYVTGLTGLAVNNTYFLSDVTAGLLTTTEPTIVGHIAKSMLVANSSTSGWILPYPGYYITSGGSSSVITGATSLGSGSAIYAGTVANNLHFKSLSGGSGISLSSTANAITICSTLAISGTANRIAQFNAGGNNITATTMSFLSNTLCNSCCLILKTADNTGLYLSSKSGSSNLVVLGEPSQPSVTNAQICPAGLCSDIHIQMTPKGAGGFYGLANYVYMGPGGPACNGFQITPNTVTFPSCGRLVMPQGTPDGTNVSICGAWGVNQIGCAGSGGGIIVCGGNGLDGIGGNPKTGGTLTFKAGCGVSGGVNGRIQFSGLPAKVGETCGIYIDANGKISTGLVSGASPTPFGWSNLTNGSTVAGCGTHISATTFTCNTFYGVCAGTVVTTGCANVGVGVRALGGLTIGSNNVALGQCTLVNNTSGSDNIGLGIVSLYNNIGGNGNIAMGNTSLFCNTSGCQNVGIGSDTLAFNTTGNGNIALGCQALNKNVSGSNIIAIGVCAAYNSALGNDIAIGLCALRANSGGNDNIAIGRCAQSNCAFGYYNIAIGSWSLFNNGASNNIGLGCETLCATTSGNENIGVGMKAGHSNITGSRNVFLGRCAGYNETASDRLYIGNCDICTLIYGEFDNKFVCINGSVCATSTMTATNFILSSDCRLKTCIVPIEISPVNVEYKQFELISEPNQIRYGVLAQDLQENYPELVRIDDKGMLTIAHIDLIFKELAYLKNKVRELENKIG